ncbi:MAG: hypothetical protein H6825_13410 [Planctomycetes bacterium]|nr:hypothetical protein [Planctomycetota bacterium]
MNTFNSVTSTVFDLLFGWYGSFSAWIDIIFWSCLGGVVALVVYKHVSNQKGIERAKNDIKVHLMEIRLFQDDLLGVFASVGKILVKNVLYIGHNIMPMVVMLVPMMAIIVQLVANYGYAPIDPGKTELLTATLDPTIAGPMSVKATDVRLELPAGIELVDRVRSNASGEIAWKLHLAEAGDHVAKIHVGDQVIEKRIAVGGDPRKIPVMRTKSLEGLLYPGEAGLDADSPIADVRIAYPQRDLGWLPGGEVGIMGTVFVLSLLIGFAFKGVFGVTL